MSLIRATLLLCITILLSVGATVYTNSVKDRFEIIALKEGVFIFDRQSSASNFCNDNKCIVLSSEFLIPKKVLVSEIPGVVTKTQLQVQNPAALPQQNYSAAPLNPTPAPAAPTNPEPSAAENSTAPYNAAPMAENSNGQQQEAPGNVAPAPQNTYQN